jgi:uncharacterized OsmC-like protein
VKREHFEIQATGEIELEDKVLVIKRIHVTYRLRIPADQHEVAERVHAVHHRACPVYRSIEAAIDVSTQLELT